MKILAILSVIGLALVYVAIGAFGVVMSAFCFDAGTGPEAWQCFNFINLITIAPSVLAIVAGMVLLFMRRYKLAIAVAAAPALIAAVFMGVVFVVNLLSVLQLSTTSRLP